MSFLDPALLPSCQIVKHLAQMPFYFAEKQLLAILRRKHDVVLGRVGPGNFAPSRSQIPDVTLSRHRIIHQCEPELSVELCCLRCICSEPYDLKGAFGLVEDEPNEGRGNAVATGILSDIEMA
jgi:hypothetical protein